MLKRIALAAVVVVGATAFTGVTTATARTGMKTPIGARSTAQPQGFPCYPGGGGWCTTIVQPSHPEGFRCMPGGGGC
jgi:hypothetical protein